MKVSLLLCVLGAMIGLGIGEDGVEQLVAVAAPEDSPSVARVRRNFLPPWSLLNNPDPPPRLPDPNKLWYRSAAAPRYYENDFFDGRSTPFYDDFDFRNGRSGPAYDDFDFRYGRAGPAPVYYDYQSDEYDDFDFRNGRSGPAYDDFDFRYGRAGPAPVYYDYQSSEEY